MQTKDQLQQTLGHARVVRVQFDEHLLEVRQRVELHLANVAGACMHELKCLRSDNEIADGNIDNAKEQLDEAIKQFRNVQATIKAQDEEIEDLVRDLADEELWKEN